MRASEFLGAQGIEPKEKVSASKKLGAAEAKQIIKESSKIIIAKGRKLSLIHI